MNQKRPKDRTKETTTKKTKLKQEGKGKKALRQERT